MKIEFYLRFKTQYGQALFVSGNLLSLGHNEPASALPLRYLNEEFWYGAVDIDAGETGTLHYHYIFQTEAGERVKEGEKHRAVDLQKNVADLVLVDSWNDESFVENAFYTAPFQQVFFNDSKKQKIKKEESYTHLFKVKAPLLQPAEAVCLLGNAPEMGGWNTEAPLLLTKKGGWWTVRLTLSNASLPASYKYGIINTENGLPIRFESGENRAIFNDDVANKKPSFMTHSSACPTQPGRVQVSPSPCLACAVPAALASENF